MDTALHKPAITVTRRERISDKKAAEAIKSFVEGLDTENSSSQVSEDVISQLSEIASSLAKHPGGSSQS
jgi:uncharacterized phage infection (PIP) family protein YhgE